MNLGTNINCRKRYEKDDYLSLYYGGRYISIISSEHDIVFFAYGDSLVNFYTVGSLKFIKVKAKGTKND
jgi:hypothetical protein